MSSAGEEVIARVCALVDRAREVERGLTESHLGELQLKRQEVLAALEAVRSTPDEPDAQIVEAGLRRRVQALDEAAEAVRRNARFVRRLSTIGRAAEGSW